MQLDIYLGPSAEHLRVQFDARDVQHPDDLEIIDVTIQGISQKQFDLTLPSLTELLRPQLAGQNSVSVVVFSNGRIDISCRS